MRSLTRAASAAFLRAGRGGVLRISASTVPLRLPADRRNAWSSSSDSEGSRPRDGDQHFGLFRKFSAGTKTPLSEPGTDSPQHEVVLPLLNVAGLKIRHLIPCNDSEGTAR